jgi:hypothetical protein
MKFTATFLSWCLVLSTAAGTEKAFLGSTPADPEVRAFLGISLADSIDFIRWKLIFGDHHYQLSCHYGIGKPGTNGFIGSGKKIELSGVLEKEKNYYKLQNGNKTFWIVTLNEDLVHLANQNKKLLLGNGGWSYTLNSTTPLHSDRFNLTSSFVNIKDSLAYQGRTPCGVPGVIEPGRECYKLKWYLILYPKKGDQGSGNYKVLGTPWRKAGGISGNWKVITGKNGRIIYQLTDDNGKGFLYLLKLDEQLLVFTDANGRLLVGNEDFSYTLNRSMKNPES